jgi:hypothetical protein
MLDVVLLAATVALTVITLVYGVACQMLMRADSTRDQTIEA